MNRLLKIVSYGTLACIVIILDRLTKVYALAHCVEPCTINRFVSLECIFNSGISWGILSSEQNIIHMGIAFLIAAIIVIMTIYSYRRWQQGISIIGEILVIAGALSNLVDRILYRGVVDFIHLSCGSWSWPNFNVADCSIVLGVCLMLITLYKKP
jgi:signal peptidase II